MSQAANKTAAPAMRYSDFKKSYATSRGEISREVYREHRDSMELKKEKTAVKNYGKIFEAVFRLSYHKGFQAMSLRDLSRETGLSMGALYRYFASKDELLSIILQQGQSMIKRAMADCAREAGTARDRLRAVIRTHIFLSEYARQWFYFIFMEARSLEPESLARALDMEAYTEKLIIDILKQGRRTGEFLKRDPVMTAGLIKAMQQDWYLKRWKYRRKKITVDRYAETVIAVVESWCLAPARGAMQGG